MKVSDPESTGSKEAEEEMSNHDITQPSLYWLPNTILYNQYISPS